MRKLYSELPSWVFDLDEVSANVYEVIAEDRHGHRVSTKGIDPEALLEQCRSEVLELVARGLGR